MELTETSRINGEDAQGGVSIPRGGPIFFSDLVGPLTTVYEFESAVCKELEGLKAELYSESSTLTDDEDISVEELKVFTDEELVGKAMEEAFKDEIEAENSSHLPENLPGLSQEADGRRTEDRPRRTRRRRNASVSCESSNGSSHQASDNGEIKNANLRKKERREMIVHEKNNAINERYLAKAKELAKIREKQIEDKALAKLHSLQSATRLQSLNATRKDKKQKKNHGAVSSQNNERIKSLESLSSLAKVRPSILVNMQQFHTQRWVLCIEVYHNKRTWQKTQEIMVLGQQTITDLRDKINCLTDVVMQKAERHDPSGYFLIEDVFCNDLRDPSAIDYSEPILDWLQNSKEEALAKWECIISGVVKKSLRGIVGHQTISHLPSFKAVEMHKVRFNDLRFRLGAGYLYCHQGDCKHIIIIRDMRLIHPDDVQNRAAYPILSFRQKFLLKKCSVCGIYKATKVTIDDKWAGKNPCCFCDNCYYLLHYTEDGSLLYDQFSVYDYLQDC
ncbi:hypothetical protein Ancab_013986 [Ancistrocladus abbreviatus]